MEGLSKIDAFFMQQEEPEKSCLLFLRSFILQYDKNITEVWRYKMPFYFFHEKRFCYLWSEKKSRLPYLGLVDGKKIDHPALKMENRTRMKIMLIDPSKDVPVKTLKTILKAAILLVQSGK